MTPIGSCGEGEGDGTTVRRREVHVAATVDLLNLPEIRARRCYLASPKPEKALSCLTRRNGPFALRRSALPHREKGDLGDAIVGGETTHARKRSTERQEGEEVVGC
nr:hypothetical protein Itr_chr10CG09820 [Ipomoea trifida]